MPIRSRALHPKPYALLPILLACLLACAPSTGQPVSRRPPNIVFLLTDDQGYGDLSCTGNPTLRTPNMDRLHDEGVRFTDFHVSPTCSPTRSALMTGRHEFRSGVTRTILERERMALSAVTNAQVLKRAGYATGIFGKWHLGDEDAYQPGRRGFDEVFIHGGGGIGQTYEGSCGDAPGNTYFDPAILHNGRFERTHGYCTDVFYGQAIRWMDRMRTRRRPFFAYVPCNAPHEPLQVRPEDGARYSGRVADRRVARYFGMIANIDDNVGRLLAKLHDWGIERDTLVLFMNDNGGTFGVPVFNAGMRGGKVTAFLGGTRAASFWRWPGTLKPADVDALAAHIDVFPRLAEIAGVRLSPKEAAQVEGRSLVPLLANPAAPWPERTLFTHVGRWPKGAPPSAYKYANGSVRTPRWHLVSASTGAARNWMLFDVRADPGEQTDVALENPSVVREMDALFDRWWLSVQPFLVNEDAVGPPVNPFKARYRKQFADLTPRPPSGDGKGEPSRGDTDGRDKEHAPGVDSPRAAASPDLVPDRPSGTEREQLSRAAGGQDAEPAPRQSSRRTPSPSGGATAGATVSVHAIVQSPPHPIVKRPNVLFVIADQWRQSAFGFAGNGDVRTPNLDRFAAQSVRFSNAVSTIPVCSPTRATILTGQRALTHGVFMNDVPLSPAAVTLPKILARAGYDMAFIGKWHVDGHGRSAYIPPERRQGFQYFKALECTHDYNASAYYADDNPAKERWPGYDADAQTDDACAYLRGRAGSSKPFLLFLSWGPPHEPYQTAPERYAKLYAEAVIALRPNVPPERRAIALRELRGYYAHCTALDDCFGRLMQALHESGADENTIVVFTSDHGDMLWSQGAEKKQQPYEESARVPLLVRYPARFGPLGRSVAAAIGTEDILPTLLGLCRLPKPPSVQGLDFSRAMAGGRDPSGGAAIVMCPAPFGQWSRARGGREYRAIRTERYTYAADLHGPWLLFDNLAEPYQQQNLVGRPEQAALQRDLDALLRAKLKARGDAFLPAAAYIKQWGYTVDATGTVPYDP